MSCSACFGMTDTCADPQHYEDEPKPIGSAEWADWWEAQWGRANLDGITRQHLDRMRTERGEA